MTTKQRATPPNDAIIEHGIEESHSNIYDLLDEDMLEDQESTGDSKRLRSKMVRKKDITVTAYDAPLESVTNISQDTLNIIIYQLKFKPTNLLEVSYADPVDSHPVILKLYPLSVNETHKNGKKERLKSPFPTLFWMSCPVLHAKICQFEVDGWVDKLNNKFWNSPESKQWLETMRKAHKQYAEERWALLSEYDKEHVISKGWLRPLRDSGIIGMKEFHNVKCLHGHYAHFLSRPDHKNIIGEWIHELVLTGNVTGVE